MKFTQLHIGGRDCRRQRNVFLLIVLAAFRKDEFR
jgi:hypothetical protein